MKEQGFYAGPTEEHYQSMRQIKNKSKGPVRVSPSPDDYKEYNLADWTAILSRRQNERQEATPIPKHIDIDFRTDQPVAVALIGDVHAGAGMADYERLQDEVLAISETEGVHAMLLGDLVDGYFFQPAKEDAVANLDEEGQYAQAVFNELEGRMLCAWLGDHDGWAEKMGPSIYHKFLKRTGTHLLQGTSYVSMHVGDQDYKLAGAHRFGGHSIYNNTHSALRVYRDEANGADICVTGHTHRKGHLRQPVRLFGETKSVDFISVGPYKYSDKYARKLGYGQQGYDEMGGMLLTLHPDRRQVDVEYDIRTGIEKFKSSQE